MPYKQSGEVRYFIFKSFQSLNVTHAIFTRRGGYSPAPWKSLNMGGTVGDDHERIVRNQQLAFKAIGRDPLSIHDVWQVHGSSVVRVNAPRPLSLPHTQADAMITDKPFVTLFMRFADCVPILLYDPIVEVVGLVHSGWQGTVRKIVKKTVSSMSRNFGCKPEDIIAGIGPSISVNHYSVGQEVEEAVRDSLGINGDKVLRLENGLVKFDLWEANRILLLQSGVNRIEIANVCTASHPEDWYSYRGEGGRTGRFGVAIGLDKKQ